MGANFVSNIYTWYFLSQQYRIRQVYVGSLQQYRTRRNILISNIVFPITRQQIRRSISLRSQMWYSMGVTYLWTHPLIHWLIDELSEWVSEWVGEWVVIDDVTAWPPDYQWVKLILYAPWESEWAMIYLHKISTLALSKLIYDRVKKA